MCDCSALLTFCAQLRLSSILLFSCFCLFSYLFFFSLSLSLISRKPHRMRSVSGAGMIGQREAGCHRTLTLIEYTHTHTLRKKKEEEEKDKNWGGGQWKSKVSRSSGRPVSTWSHHILQIQRTEVACWGPHMTIYMSNPVVSTWGAQSLPLWGQTGDEFSNNHCKAPDRNDRFTWHPQWKGANITLQG